MSPARVPSLTVAEICRLMPAITTAEQVGYGGQKQVFKAILDGKAVALKVVLADQDSSIAPVDAAASTVITGEASTLLIDEDEEAESLSAEDLLVPSRLRREVELLTRISSPNVVPLVAINGRHLVALPDRDRGLVYMAYAEAWIEGQDLDGMLHKGTRRMAQEEVVTLALDGITGIAALWNHEVVHRDIKPHNIMRRASDGRFLLIDLGLALDIQAETITETGVWLGTMAFAAPEINDPEFRTRVDFRADLFSLGIVLYEALAAQHPYGARTQGRTVSNARNLMRRPPASLSEAFPGVHPKLSEMVMRMIEADFELRYARLAQVENALRTIARDLGVQP